MKKYFINIITCVALGAAVLSSCINDDSEYVGTQVSDIKVSDINDSYEATSYVGQVLSISPKIESGYSNLQYEWTLLNAQTGKLNAAGDTIKPVLLGNEKDLNMEVNLSPGIYQLRFKCSAENGYQNTIAASLSVVTEFSKGLYILKETTDGNTDIDLITANGTFSKDLIKSVHGSAMAGKPGMLNIIYDGFYINTETDKMEGVNKVVVTTEGGDFLSMRCTDLSKIFDRSNIRFEAMDADEKVISETSSENYELMFTTKGVYYVGVNSIYVQLGYFNPNSGRFGMPSPATCSRYFVYDSNAYGSGIFWDDNDKSIKSFGPTVDVVMSKELDEIEDVKNMTGSKCVYMGINQQSGYSFAIIENADGTRNLFRFKGEYIRALYTYICAYKDKLTVPATSHLAKTSIISCNGIQAPYIYCVDGGKLYGTNVNTEELPEMELPLEGIGAGEKITYITNQYYTKNNDYLYIGTESGSNYKLYKYKMTNGIPDGSPVEVVTGSGKIRSVRYLNDTYSSYASRSIVD